MRGTMTRFLYCLLRIANFMGGIEDAAFRRAISNKSAIAHLQGLVKAELSKPISYVLPLTGRAMAPSLNQAAKAQHEAHDRVRLAISHTLPLAILPSFSTTRTNVPVTLSRLPERQLVIRRLNANSQAFLNKVYVNDVVVVRDPHDARRKYVRRVAGLPGDELVSDRAGDPPMRIPSDHCWVVRDNEAANTSPDSRKFGPLSLKLILGRVMYAIRSATDHGRVVSSPYAMASDSIVLAQEPITPHLRDAPSPPPTQ